MAKTKTAVTAPVQAVVTPAEDKTTPIMFSKGKLLTFKRYANRVDLLTALLNDDREYSLVEVDSMLEKFMKGRVN